MAYCNTCDVEYLDQLGRVCGRGFIHDSAEHIVIASTPRDEFEALMRERKELLSMVKRMRLSFTALRLMNGDLGPAARSQCGALEREASELVTRIEGRA